MHTHTIFPYDHDILTCRTDVVGLTYTTQSDVKL